MGEKLAIESQTLYNYALLAFWEYPQNLSRTPSQPQPTRAKPCQYQSKFFWGLNRKIYLLSVEKKEWRLDVTSQEYSK